MDYIPTCERSKILEENIGDRLHELGGGKDFLNRTQKVLTRKRKNDNLTIFKIKRLSTSKDTTKLPTEWEREGMQSYIHQRT